MTARTIFLVLLTALLSGIAIATVMVALAMSQERHGWGHGDRGGPGRGYGGQRYYEGYRRPGYRYEAGRGWYNPSAAIGGAIGSYLWRQWNQPQQPVRDVAWCMNRYRSYDPYTRTYLSYEGVRMACP